MVPTSSCRLESVDLLSRRISSFQARSLRRIEEGEYGYCDETGEPISLARLDARPVATLSLEAQERHERSERVHRDD
jgi:DnaK suppressor protein